MALNGTTEGLPAVESKGDLVTIVSWLAMVIMCLGVVTRIATKFAIMRRLGLDDALITTAMFIVLGWTIAVSVQVSNGLGQHMDTLSEATIVKYQKAYYASDLLFLPALALSKLSIVIYVVQFMPRNYMIANRILIASISTWATVGLVAIAFQCHMPRPWAVLDSSQCYAQKNFWIVMGAVDILSECFIVVFPVSIISRLQMKPGTKFAVMFAFVVRLLIIPVIVLRLIYISQASTKADRTFADFKPVIITLVDLNSCIFLSCVPYLKPFMEGLPAGCLIGGFHNPLGFVSGSKELNKSYALESTTTSRSRDRPRQQPPNIDDSADKYNKTTVTATPFNVDAPRDDGESRTSAGSDRMIIKQTKGWTVHYDEEQHGNAGLSAPKGL